ncbi:hypothetical protein CsatA_024495 [Cannabis sativa]
MTHFDGRRFLVLAYPAQGCLNPSLIFAETLIRVIPNSQVTFVTSLHANRRLTTTTKQSSLPNDNGANNTSNLSFTPFSDGFDDGFTIDDIERQALEFSRRGSQAVCEILKAAHREGNPYTCLVYNFILTWAADVAAEHKVPAAMFWLQPATVFNIYDNYFHGYKEIIRDNSKNSSFSLSFSGTPFSMSIKDLPSFMDESTEKSSYIRFYQEIFEGLEKEGTNTKLVLANTFDELEPEVIRVINNKFNLIGIGPLIKSTSFKGSDLSQQSSVDYIEWLNTKPKTTVVYVSFGSISNLSQQQMEEIGKGLLEFGRPFLWVIRENVKDNNNNSELSCRKELDKLGMIVSWCSQMEVLSNESIGCFLTHCGWNSTLESLASGVPMVAFPQWTDQWTNAKLVEDLWKTGVRVKPNEDGIVTSGEIKRCLELVMGENENGVEIVRSNAKKWQNSIKEAMKEGGSSEKNFINSMTNVIY